jgi:hypothetical protein
LDAAGNLAVPNGGDGVNVNNTNIALIYSNTISGKPPTAQSAHEIHITDILPRAGGGGTKANLGNGITFGEPGTLPTIYRRVPVSFSQNITVSNNIIGLTSSKLTRRGNIGAHYTLHSTLCCHDSVLLLSSDRPYGNRPGHGIGGKVGYGLFEYNYISGTVAVSC